MKPKMSEKKSFMSLLLFLLLGTFLFFSCSTGDMPRENSTDSKADNYSPTAPVTQQQEGSTDCVLGQSSLGECGL